ncbi:MAG: methyltransferase domain-containing protein [Deltaproteobacteria bacterium]|nr:MAG: methyltransferase domain-containing protein [Deltaproteobacteria bacterium]
MTMEEEFTRDRISHLGLTLYQPARGYRFSIDSLLLASFASAQMRGGSCLDAGAGCGVVSLCLARLREDLERIVAVEVQERLCRLAERNVRENGLEGRVDVVHADLTVFARTCGERFDSIVSNPPYIPVDAGRPSPHGEREVARQEVSLDSASLAASVRVLLKEGGRFFVIYPAWRIRDVVVTFSEEGLDVTCIRPVHPKAGEEASHVLLSGSKSPGGECRLLPPLVVYTDEGEYTPEARRILYQR